MNTFLTKLNGVFENDNLPYVDGAVLEITVPVDTDLFLGDSIDSKDPCYIELLNGKFSDGQTKKPLINLSAKFTSNKGEKNVLALLSPISKLKVGPYYDNARALNIQDYFDWLSNGVVSIYLSDSYGIGDLESLKNLTSLRSIQIDETKVTGLDISKTPASVSHLRFSTPATWTSRPSSSNIIALEAKTNNAKMENIDKMLQDQAQCQVGFTSSDGVWMKTIHVYGTRTSASDDAVATLQQKGYTISIAKA